jgi:uncharacterized protein
MSKIVKILFIFIIVKLYYFLNNTAIRLLYCNLDGRINRRNSNTLSIPLCFAFLLIIFFIFLLIPIAYAQSADLKIVKYRNLTIDLGNGLKTHAQLTLPAIGNGPFPAVLLIQGSGALDMNETLSNSSKPFWQISQYLAERGFVVLKYDKRGIGPNNIIIDNNAWGNLTFDDLKNDSKKALDILIQQPEVDPKRISIIGHSEGTIIAPRLAIDDSSKVKNIVLMGIVAQDFFSLGKNQYVDLPVEYAKVVFDKNNTGTISIQQVAKFLHTNDTKYVRDVIAKEFGNNIINSNSINIDSQLKPLLLTIYKNMSIYKHTKCVDKEGCPAWIKSEINLDSNLNIIANVSKSTGILMLNGENDIQTPVEQAFLLQQRLTEVNHPDHLLITYPQLGHVFYPSDTKWRTGIGPIQQNVLFDLYKWLQYHS